jgi:transcriptional regulator with XRE-family HTH domain
VYISLEKNKDEIGRKFIFDQQGLDAFAAHLKGLRKVLGFTKSQLAFEASLSLSQIALIESAKINHTLSTFFAIARALNVPIETLFKFSLPDSKRN